MTNSAGPADFSTPLLQHSHLNQARLQSPPGPRTVFRWFIAALGTGGVAATQGYFSVTNFIDKSTLTGGLFGAGTLVCAGACAYCIYRAVNPIQHRNIQPIVPAVDAAAAKANVQMLRLINSRLNTMLSEESDLEAGIDDAHLHESINRQLQELEQMLPQMRTELGELRQTVAAVLETRSVGSPGDVGLNSPVLDDSFQRGILAKFDDLAKKVARSQSSRNSSRFSSTTASPARGITNSLLAASPAFSPVPRAVRKITFGSVNTIESPPAGGTETE